MTGDDFVGLGLSSRASSTINDADRVRCVFPALAEIDWPWRCSVCYDRPPQSFIALNVVGATGPGFQVLLNPLLALAAVSLAQAGPAPEIYLAPICSECRPFNLTDIVFPHEPEETTLGSVCVGNGCVGIAFASADYSREFIRINEHLVFPNGEGLANFTAKENLKAAREERTKRHKPVGWKIQEERLREILKDFEPVKAFSAKPDIPPAKLSTASIKCEVPPSETIVGLLDLTTFGSAKRAILFGLEGIYGKGVSKAQHLPYNEFPSCVFTQAKGSPAISAGEKGTLPFGGVGKQYPLLRVLGRIKHEVMT
jgi:hypothetical protein